jgi:hypothetical protein
MRRSAALTTLALLAVAAPALAQPSTVPPVAPPAGPGAVAATPPAPPDTAVAPAAEIPQSAESAPQIPTPAEQLVDGDAAGGRAYLSTNGFTARKGTAGAQVWAPAIPVAILAAGTYAITDRIEIAAGGFAVLADDDDISAGYLAAKVQVLRRRSVGVALQIQYLDGPEPGDDSLTFLSAAGSKCLGASCRTVVTAHLSVFPTSGYTTDAFGSSMSETAVHVLAGGSIVSGRKVKVVLDAFTFGEGEDQGLVVYAGLRAARHRWSADVGFIGFSDGDDTEVLPVPLASGAFRF